MNIANPQTASAEDVIAAIRAWLDTGGAEIVRRDLDDVRAETDAMIRELEMPPHALDLPVTY